MTLRPRTSLDNRSTVQNSNLIRCALDIVLNKALEYRIRILGAREPKVVIVSVSLILNLATCWSLWAFFFFLAWPRQKCSPVLRTYNSVLFHKLAWCWHALPPWEVLPVWQNTKQWQRFRVGTRRNTRGCPGSRHKWVFCQRKRRPGIEGGYEPNKLVFSGRSEK